LSESAAPAVRVARGAIYIYVQGVASYLITVVYFAFATRILSVAEIGVIASLAMISSFFTTFGTLAIPSAATKYVSEFIGRDRPRLAKGVFKKSLYFGFIASIISSLACFAVSYIISVFVFESEANRFLVSILALDVFALVLLTFFSGVLAGLQKFKEVSAINVVINLVRSGSALFLILRGYGILGVVSGWIAGDFTGLILHSFFSLTSFKNGSESFPFSRLAKYSLPLYASAAVGYLSTYVDRFLILFYAGFANLGIYNVAMVASGAVGLVSNAIGSALFPQLSERYGKAGLAALKDASFRASRYVSLVYVPLAVGLAVTALPTITLFAGVQYMEGAALLAVFSISMALTALSIIVNSVLSSLAKTRILLEVNSLAVFVDTLLCLILLPYFGVVGAAFGRAASTIVFFAYCDRRLKSIHKFRYDGEAFKKSWLGSIVMGLIVLVLEVVWMDRLLLPLYVLVGGVAYLSMLRILRVVNASDVILVRNFLPRQMNSIVEFLARVLGVRY